jgi:acyl-coenzyme A thioesterase PaaI-like protein
MTDIQREPVRGGTGHASLAALPGVEALRSWLTGDSPAPPLARLTGRRLIAVDVGAATFALPISPWTLGPKGRVHKGVLAFLGGAPLFGAVQSALPERTSCTTAEISMTFLGEPPEGGGELTAAGRLIATAGDTGAGCRGHHGTRRAARRPRHGALPDLPARRRGGRAAARASGGRARVADP